MQRLSMSLAGEVLENRALMASDVLTPVETAPTATVPTATAAVNVGAFCGTGTATPATHVKVVYEKAAAEDPLDINRDGVISPDDIDRVVVELSARMELRTSSVTAEAEPAAAAMDVNSDGHFTPLDALHVINRVNAYNSLVPCNCGTCLANAIVHGSNAIAT
jgi:hypothetical protein